METTTVAKRWDPAAVGQLRKICGDRSVLADAASLAAYENDGLSFNRHRPDCVVIPKTSDELKRVVQFCNGKDFPYLIRGAGTSLSGGPVAVAGGVIIHVSNLKNIVEINTEDQYCVVEPGVVLNELNHQLGRYGFFYPPDPSSGYSSTLGGNVGENAGGLRCFKYGVTANYVLGLEVITTDGQIVQLGGPAGGWGPTMGPDWRALMVGSEGMLATFTKIWLRIRPLPEKIYTFLAEFQDLKTAAEAIVELVRYPAIPVALEFIDNKTVRLVEASAMAVGLDRESWAVLLELDGPAALVREQAVDIEKIFQAHNVKSLRKTDDLAERTKLWRARKSANGLMGQVSPDYMIQDAVIPRSHLGELLQTIYDAAEAVDTHVLNVFHAGDGNLHPCFLFDARDPEQVEKIHDLGKILMKKVIGYGGVLSGEHGIGNDKSKYIPLYFGEREIAMQQTLIEVFNPDNQLNPEKVFPQRSFVGCCAPEKAR